MKVSNIYLVGFISLFIGFGMAWMIKPPHNPITKTSQHHHNITASEYTCSMHPQVRQNEPGLCPLCEMDLIPVGSQESDDPTVLQMTPEAIQLANIQTTIIGRSQAQSEKIIPLSGKIQADERLASSQVAHVPGRIEQLFVSFTGESVQKGQKIATLYSPELITAQRELLEAIKLKDLNPNLVEAARNKLRFWKIGESTIQQIEQHGKIQETFTVHADESGIVTKRRVAVGDHLAQGEPLFDLMNLEKVWVVFDGYEEQLAHIAIGDKIAFTTPAVPNKTFQTTVTFIDPIIKADTRVTAIRTELNNKKGLLKPEMLVYGNLQKKSMRSSQLTIPKSAVLWTGKRSVVYVKVPDVEIPSFEFREVELGSSLGEHYVAISGLEAGEEVVTYGSFTIDAAAQLNNQASMMNRKVIIKKELTSPTALPDYTDMSSSTFKTQLFELVSAYLLLKDALVETDSEAAKVVSLSVLKALEQVDNTDLKGSALTYWTEQATAIQVHTGKIAASNDVEQQRQQFEFVSQALIQAIKVYGIGDQTLYVQHCPMAFDDRGADWISDVEAIRNPYFGDKMLKCGVVKTTIDAVFSND